MVFVLNENKAARIFENYKEVAAFTLGSAKKPKDLPIAIEYEKCDFLPDADTINEILDQPTKKQMKKKGRKAIEAAVNACMNPTKGDLIALSMAQLVGIVKDSVDDLPEGIKKKNAKKYFKKHAPAVMVFVLDGENPVKDAFLTNYIQALFGCYGIPVFTKEDKKVLKLFKEGKKPSKNAMRVLEFIRKNDIGLSKKGRKLYQSTITYYALEITQTSLASLDPTTGLTKKRANTLIDRVLTMATCKNLQNMAKQDAKKGDLKRMAKKNKKMVEYYDEVAAIMGEVVPDTNMPTLKFGVSKKAKKKGKYEPKMDKKKIKKFIKWFFKRVKSSNGGNVADRREMLRVIYAHLTVRLLGEELGSSDYTKYMKSVMNGAWSKDFVDSYITAAKNLAKADA